MKNPRKNRSNYVQFQELNLTTCFFLASISAKLKYRKNKSIDFQLRNERHFGECDINMTRQGDFAMKVKLYPYEPKQITVNIERNVIVLNAEMKKADKTVKTITRPDIAGFMFKKSVSMITSETATKEFTLPIEIEPSSVQTKFEDGFFHVSGYLRH